MRLQTGQEALVARVLTTQGKVGYGFSFQLDAAAARHMAMYSAGLLAERPRLQPVLGHPWETAWVSGEPIDWNAEPGFAKMRWLPED
jgi:hypothetical protein